MSVDNRIIHFQPNDCLVSLFYYSFSLSLSLSTTIICYMILQVLALEEYILFCLSYLHRTIDATKATPHDLNVDNLHQHQINLPFFDDAEGRPDRLGQLAKEIEEDEEIAAKSSLLLKLLQVINVYLTAPPAFDVMIII